MNTHLLLKSLHIAGVVLFLGNLLVTAWWKVAANRSRSPLVIAFAQRQVTATDFVFTAAGAALLAAGGYGSAVTGGIALHTHWLAAGHWLFVVSGLMWVLVLIPVQILQARSARSFAAGAAIPTAYWQREKLWAVCGVVATLLPLCNLYFMVFKPL